MTTKNKDSRINISITSQHDDTISALMVRAAVYVGELDIPLNVALDANDFSSTHVLARVDGQPAASMRLRFFNNYAVMERLAILKEYRQKRFGARGVAWELGEYAINFCRLKGYTNFFGVSRDNMVEFWKKFAPKDSVFEPMSGVTLEFAGRHSYPMKGVAPELPFSVKGLTNIHHLVAMEKDLPDIMELEQKLAS